MNHIHMQYKVSSYLSIGDFLDHISLSTLYTAQTLERLKVGEALNGLALWMDTYQLQVSNSQKSQSLSSQLKL